MKVTDFDVYVEILRKHCGLTLRPEDTYTLNSRLGAIAAKWGYPALGAMTAALQIMPDPALIDEIAAVMMPTDTWFFRDRRSFAAIEEAALPALQSSRRKIKYLKVWCAGVSRGQEALSLAMTFKELQDKGSFPGWRLDILATDLPSEALDHAREGVYTQFDVQRGLPVRLLLKYFTRETDGSWRAGKALRQMIRFQENNLLQEARNGETYDIILCRNVLTCMEEESRVHVLKRLARQLARDGILVLGNRESCPPGAGFVPLPGFKSLFAKKPMGMES